MMLVMRTTLTIDDDLALKFGPDDHFEGKRENKRFLQKKLGLKFIGGLSASILIDNDATLKIGDKSFSFGKTENISPVTYNSTLGLGFGYNISKKVSFNLEPSFKYSLNSINQSADVHPYSIGIFSGLNYRF